MIIFNPYFNDRVWLLSWVGPLHEPHLKLSVGKSYTHVLPQSGKNGNAD